MGKSILRNAAQDLAASLLNSAQWSKHGCNWQVSTTDKNDVWSRRSVRATTGPSLYQGNSGIALALSAFAGLTNSSEVHGCIHGALESASKGASNLSVSDFGLFTGRLGVAYTMVSYARQISDERWIRAATELIEPLIGHEKEDTVLDVIGGASSGIPTLLYLSKWLNEPRYLRCAVALGEHLCAKVEALEHGFGLPMQMSGQAGSLTGFAHGSAGAAHAFVELYAETGDSRFAEAAVACIDYENALFDSASSNWPDLRDHALSSALSTRERAERYTDEYSAWRWAEQLPTRSYSMWCHGAPGIGLSRLRIFELTGWRRALADAMLAIDTTSRAIYESGGSWCLCHGVLGNAQTLVAASRVLGEPSYHASVTDRVETYLATRSSAAWPSGTQDRSADPSLMLGDAGVLWMLVSLAGSDVPDCLILRPSSPRSGNVAFEAITQSEKESPSSATHLSHSIKAEPGLPVEQIAPYAPGRSPLDERLKLSRSELNTPIQATRATEAQNDILLRARSFQAGQRLATIDELLRRFQPRRWHEAKLFALAPYVFLTDTHPHDRTETSSDVVQPNHHVIWRWTSKGFDQTPVSAIVATIFSLIDQPRSLRSILSALMTHSDTSLDADGIAMLEQYIEVQLEHAYNAGIVRTYPEDFPENK